MKKFSIYTFSVLSLAALSAGSLKEVVKIYLSGQPLEGWGLVIPILSTSLYLCLYFLGKIFGKKMNTPLLLSNSSFLFISSFSIVFLFVFYGIFMSNSILLAFFESTIYALIFSALAVILMKYFYRSNIKKLLDARNSRLDRLAGNRSHPSGTFAQRSVPINRAFTRQKAIHIT